MIKNYSPYLFKLLLALLLMSAVIMCTLAYRTTIQEEKHYSALLERSTISTSREIELYLNGLQRVLNLFASEQRNLLADVISNPKKLSLLQEKISQHFPEHLTFAVGDIKMPSPFIAEPELFGEHCQANFNSFSQKESDLEPILAIHNTQGGRDSHFDLMTYIQANDSSSDPIGIIFISFRVKDLLRLLEAGSSPAHTLFLESKSTEIIDTFFGDVLSPKFNTASKYLNTPKFADRSENINGTPWVLHGRISIDNSSRLKNLTYIQTVIGLMVLLVAGFVAWRSIQQEKISHNRNRIVLESVDAERKRIASELHDHVLSDVNHAKRLLMDVLPRKSELSSTDTKKLQEVESSIDNFSHTIRISINNLYPHILDNLGLGKALESTAQSCQKLGIEYQLNFDDSIDNYLHAEQKLHLYRIISELTNNSLKHSNCQKINVTASLTQKQLVIKFKDNGKDFTDYIRENKKGLGISNIESRVSALKGKSSWIGNQFELVMTIKTLSDE